MADDPDARPAAIHRAQKVAAARQATRATSEAARYNRRVQEHNEAVRRAQKAAVASQSPSEPRGRISQADVPIWTLGEAYPVAHAVHARGGVGAPVAPEELADQPEDGGGLSGPAQG